MFTKPLFSLLVFVATFQVVHAQTSTPTGDTFTTVVGKWSGSFEGDAAGKFELVINQDNSKKLTGQVIMLADDGNRYPIDLKTISWQNGQLKATYIDPAEGDEVNFTGTFSGSTLKGSWKSDGGQSIGTWQASRATR